MQLSVLPAKSILFLGVLALGVSGCSLASKTDVSLNYYLINGNTLKQLDREIRVKGPRINGTVHAVAVSTIKMTPDIALSSRYNGCIVSRARIKVRTIITLPRWKNRQNAGQDLVRAWDNLDRYTRLHEAVHVSIARKYAKQLELQLKTLKTGKSCDQTGRTARAIIDRTMKNHEREQLEFDTSEKTRFSRLSKRNRSS